MSTRSFPFAAILLAAPLSAETYVIRNATVMTVSKGTFKGSIVVKDGKIAEVGEKVMEPADAKIIDASNQYVIPGILESASVAPKAPDPGTPAGDRQESARPHEPWGA